MEGGRIGYYHKKEVATMKMYRVLRELKGLLDKGYTWAASGRSAKEKEISLRKFLPERGISTQLSPFVSAFDFSKTIYPDRVAAEREQYIMQLQIDRALRKAGVKASRRGRKAVKAEPPKAEPRKENVPMVPDVRLLDWKFTDHMRGMETIWEKRDGGTLRTRHSLEPNVGYYVEGTQGEMRLKRTAGSFLQGKLTAHEQKRILVEARGRLLKDNPALVLETMEDSVQRFRRLMR